MRPLTESAVRRRLAVAVGTARGSVAAYADRYGCRRSHLSAALKGGPLLPSILTTIGLRRVVPEARFEAIPVLTDGQDA